MTRTAPKHFIDQLKLIDNDLHVVWNSPIQRFEIWHIDSRNGLKRIIFTVEDDEGKPIPLDNRTIARLANQVDWEMLRYYPDPKEQYQIYRERKELRKKNNWSRLKEERKEFFDRNRKRIKEAEENALRGKWNDQAKKPEPKIYI